MTLYLLDTDTASFIIKGRSPEIEARLAKFPPNRVCVSAVTRAELMLWPEADFVLPSVASRGAGVPEDCADPGVGCRRRGRPCGHTASIDQHRPADWRHGHDDRGACRRDWGGAGNQKH